MKTTLQNRIATMVHAFGDEEHKSAVRLLASDVASVELNVAHLTESLARANDAIRQLREAGHELHSELLNARHRLRMLGNGTNDLPGNAAIKRWCKLTK